MASVINDTMADPIPAKKRKVEDRDVKLQVHDQLYLELNRQRKQLQKVFCDDLTEAFFLRHRGNLVNYLSWHKKRTPELQNHLRTCISKFDSNWGNSIEISDASSRCSTPECTLSGVGVMSNGDIDMIGKAESWFVKPTPLHINDSISDSTSTAPSTPTSALSSSVFQKPSLSNSQLHTPSTPISQETIVERAKQEAQVMQRVAQLRKEGLWSQKKLPKVQEPDKNKAHWDYVLEEMQWLAADFAQERKWKKNGARKIARLVMRYHTDQEQKKVKASKEEAMKLKRIAGNLSKIIREFWGNIEKVVDFKQQSRIEEKKKKALDMHLNFIVGQTEKYSSWLSEGLADRTSTGSISSSLPSSPIGGDHDFQPGSSGSDNEETIDKEPEDLASQLSEVEALKKESEQPLEDLLKSLPPEVLDKPAPIITNENVDDMGGNGDDGDDDKTDPACDDDDDEFEGDVDVNDDEATMEEQEVHEDVDHAQELKDLDEDAGLSIEELKKKYSGFQISSEIMTDDETDNSDSGETGDEDEDDAVGVDEEGSPDGVSEASEVVIKSKSVTEEEGKSENELNDIAAQAQCLQPTGYTLETTSVRTEIPFLLKHKLREYQHVGLDWLATMNEKKLNGILADEMGLGKTIQTIALLAHMAVEHGVWGPHLIVVPTSVMLNWEMEIKKWCPAMKVMTYYGSVKERRLKRSGWTKPNAFHVCITSYKLVVQDHSAFRRKKWKYFILDEAQNIKNFKSQRWQMMLNFQSQRRLLLTGTPLQNNLMELWSLMHFLMPHVFASHREFQEWFSNPLNSMIEGQNEYSEALIMRLHKVMRPFLLRRLKKDVEKQMPQKYEHVLMCSLSKRQRYLYDDFMSRAKTKETLASGHYMSVINILMQLRKVCNHPNLFDPRPITSPFVMGGLTYSVPSVTVDMVESCVDTIPTLKEQLKQVQSVLPWYAVEEIQRLRCSEDMLRRGKSKPKVNVVKQVDCSPDDFPVTLLHGTENVQPDLYFSHLVLPDLEQSRATRHSNTLAWLAHLNKMRCDLTLALGMYNSEKLNIRMGDCRQIQCCHLSWSACSAFNIDSIVRGKSHYKYWDLYEHASHLDKLIKAPQDILCELEEIFKRFAFVIPSVLSLPIILHASHIPPHFLTHQSNFVNVLDKHLTSKLEILHPISSRMIMQHPEARLIQYDCGKLQLLDNLLRRLFAGGHRTLIFTQMTKMLDVLEAFLNSHGYRYVRLDGATKVDQRQILMDRFNMDSKIFCFILSTRSGGLGINLTGADTVIFYDSDWNPTMDAQAQDRCHRIGQTRDVHIYRLISQMTVEENILKKANQKRLLGDVAIEGGNFTTAYFKKHTISELFNEPTGLSDVEEASSSAIKKLSLEQMEAALSKAEEDTDVKAAKEVRAEQRAELAEFDESIPFDEDAKQSKVEVEIASLDKELSPIERYAVKFMEAEFETETAEEMNRAEEEVSLAKEEWELSRLKALREEEEMKAELEEDEMLFTYSREESNQVKRQRNRTSVGSPQKEASRASKRIQSQTIKAFDDSAGRDSESGDDEYDDDELEDSDGVDDDDELEGSDDGDSDDEDSDDDDSDDEDSDEGEGEGEGDGVENGDVKSLIGNLAYGDDSSQNFNDSNKLFHDQSVNDGLMASTPLSHRSENYEHLVIRTRRAHAKEIGSPLPPDADLPILEKLALQYRSPAKLARPTGLNFKNKRRNDSNVSQPRVSLKRIEVPETGSVTIRPSIKKAKLSMQRSTLLSVARSMLRQISSSQVIVKTLPGHSVPPGSKVRLTLKSLPEHSTLFWNFLEKIIVAKRQLESPNILQALKSNVTPCSMSSTVNMNLLVQQQQAAAKSAPRLTSNVLSSAKSDQSINVAFAMQKPISIGAHQAQARAINYMINPQNRQISVNTVRVPVHVSGVTQNRELAKVVSTQLRGSQSLSRPPHTGYASPININATRANIKQAISQTIHNAMQEKNKFIVKTNSGGSGKTEPSDASPQALPKSNVCLSGDGKSLVSNHDTGTTTVKSLPLQRKSLVNSENLSALTKQFTSMNPNQQRLLQKYVEKIQMNNALGARSITVTSSVGQQLAMQSEGTIQSVVKAQNSVHSPTNDSHLSIVSSQQAILVRSPVKTGFSQALVVGQSNHSFGKAVVVASQSPSVGQSVIGGSSPLPQTFVVASRSPNLMVGSPGQSQSTFIVHASPNNTALTSSSPKQSPGHGKLVGPPVSLNSMILKSPLISSNHTQLFVAASSEANPQLITGNSSNVINSNCSPISTDK